MELYTICEITLLALIWAYLGSINVHKVKYSRRETSDHKDEQSQNILGNVQLDEQEKHSTTKEVESPCIPPTNQIYEYHVDG